MTKAEAKDYIREWCPYGKQDEIIKALEQEPKTDWIPVSERLPEELEPVNITWINHNPESYYADIKDKPFTATGVYFNGQWYWWSTLCADMLAEYSHNYDDIIDDDIEIIAWRSLPQPYKEDQDVCKDCYYNDGEVHAECVICDKAESKSKMLVCPACGLDVHSDFKTCPRCGAKMIELQESEE